MLLLYGEGAKNDVRGGRGETARERDGRSQPFIFFFVKRCRQGGSFQDGRAQCRMPAAGCSCLVLLFDGSEKRDGGFVCGGGRVVKKGWMRFSFCLIWFVAMYRGRGLGGREVLYVRVCRWKGLKLGRYLPSLMPSWRNPRPGGPLPRHHAETTGQNEYCSTIDHRRSLERSFLYTLLLRTANTLPHPLLTVYAVPSLHPLSTHFPHTIASTPPTSLSPRHHHHTQKQNPLYPPTT